MILTDYQIKAIFSTLIPNDAQRDTNLINPASFDVRVGNHLRLEKQGRGINLRPTTVKAVLEYQQDVSNNTFYDDLGLIGDEVYWMRPGEFVLVSMLETIHVPDDCTMSFYLKSSRAREGYEHSNAGWIDPGWKGVLTMEIKNNLGWHNLPIYSGLRIGQMKVEQLTTSVLRPYKGRYHGAIGVEVSKTADYDYQPQKQVVR